MAERRKRILVVDDRREMADMLVEGLVDRGYDAFAEGSSARALARLTDGNDPIDDDDDETGGSS